jgi:hypothetical protein
MTTRIADSPWTWRKPDNQSSQGHELNQLDHEYDDKGWCKHCGKSRYTTIWHHGGKGKCEARVVLG